MLWGCFFSSFGAALLSSSIYQLEIGMYIIISFGENVQKTQAGPAQRTAGYLVRHLGIVNLIS